MLKFPIPEFPQGPDAMNNDKTRNLLLVNAAFWATAIAFPYLIRLLPTSSGEPAKFFEFLVPVFQVMLGCGATFLVKSAIQKKA